MHRKSGHLVVALALSSAWNVCFSQDAENPPNPVGLARLPSPTVVLKSQTVRRELKFTEEQEVESMPSFRKYGKYGKHADSETCLAGRLQNCPKRSAKLVLLIYPRCATQPTAR